MIPDPSFDEQSARAALYALLVCAGEVAGFFADTEEVTHADGAIGYRPIVRRNGAIVWYRKVPINAAAGTDDARVAQWFAVDVARAHAVDRIMALAQADPDWGETLRRYRREPTNPILNSQPSTERKDKTT